MGSQSNHARAFHYYSSKYLGYHPGHYSGNHNGPLPHKPESVLSVAWTFLRRIDSQHASFGSYLYLLLLR